MDKQHEDEQSNSEEEQDEPGNASSEESKYFVKISTRKQEFYQISFKINFETFQQSSPSIKMMLNLRIRKMMKKRGWMLMTRCLSRTTREKMRMMRMKQKREGMPKRTWWGWRRIISTSSCQSSHSLRGRRSSGCWWRGGSPGRSISWKPTLLFFYFHEICHQKSPIKEIHRVFNLDCFGRTAWIHIWSPGRVWRRSWQSLVGLDPEAPGWIHSQLIVSSFISEIEMHI